jgi:putative ABC transport system permease protein
MNFLLRTWATLQIALRRLLAQRWLALATALGLVASVALIMSIPLYSDAVYYRILQEELSQVDQSAGDYSRPPFAFMWRYSGSLYGFKQWDEVQQADEYMRGEALDRLGLPPQDTVRYIKTDTFRLFPAADVASGAYASAREPMAWVSFATASNFDDHVQYVEGGPPAPASANPDEAVEAAISRIMADELGIQVGEEYVTLRKIETEAGDRNVQIPVRVSGIWEPLDAKDTYWFYPYNVFETQLFVAAPTYEGRITSMLPDEIGQMVWYWLMDGSQVHADDADRLVAAMDTILQRAGTLLPNVKLDISPYDGLRDYQQSARVLNVLLFAFSIPIVGLLLAFIGLVVGLSVARQRNEIAVLRSRGATAVQIIGIAALEAALLAGFALLLAAPLSTSVAQAIGSTKSFLNFTLPHDLRIQLTANALQYGAVALAVTVMAQVLPSLGASRHTIISYKQELARTVRAPWWQRAWLDVLLLIPVGYGVYLLQQQGSVFMPGASAGGDIFDNPLLFLLPALAALALTLIVLRLLPLLMALVAWIAARTNSVGFLLATRYLARDPGFYTTPLVLLMLTLGLSVFTASLAQTLDNHLYDRNYYSVGADAYLFESGANNQAASAFGGMAGDAAGAADSAAGAGATATPTAEEEGPQWVFVPVDEHLRVEEIEAATRVGDFPAAVQVEGRWAASTLIGIDRVDFPKVAFWRSDFAPASLGALMNALAVAPDGLLVERWAMRQAGVRVGDQVQVRISTSSGDAEGPMRIVGDFDYFPTWYSEAQERRPLLIGNLDYIFEQIGGEQPYTVWVNTADNVDYPKMLDDLRDIEISVFDYTAATERIAADLQRPERQGLFGVLSVGFLASALLTVLGFLLYALFSFRRRFIELGTLRAVGLSTVQLSIFLICELAFLILLGLGAGTGIGILISQVFIPYLQIGTGPSANIPPYTVEIAWFAISRLYLLFGVLFLVAFAVLIVLLLRMKVFQAIKLGETV